MAAAPNYARSRDFTERVPAAEEAERAALAAALLDPDALVSLLALPPEAFSDARYRVVRQALGRLNERGIGIDLTTLYEEMNAAGSIGSDSEFETFADFSALLNDGPTLYADAYAEAIMRAYAKRVQLRHGTRIVEAAARGDLTGMRAELEIAKAALERLDDTSAQGDAETANDGVWRPQTQELADLMKKQLPAIRWRIENWISEGVLLFVSKPKSGKTSLLCQLCASVAYGTLAMGQLATQRCDVLYIAAEDNERRMQRRMAKILQGEPPPRGFHIEYTWPKLDQGGLQALDTYCAEHPAVGIIVIDTWAKIRGAIRNGGGFQDDYAAMADLQALAARHQTAIVVLHHLRKASADDPFDEINASMGMLAAVDNMMVMRRGQDGVMELHRRGREFEDDDPLALQGDRDTLCWRLVGKLDDVARSDARNEIISLLRQHPSGMGPREIAQALGKHESTIKTLLGKMLAERKPVITSSGGRYFAD